MALTPEDVERQTFKERFKGYDMDEVDAFLDRVAARLNELAGERDALRRKLEEASTSSGDSERLLQRTLLMAQRTADQTVEEAQQEAARIVSEAREEAMREREHLETETAELAAAVEGLKRFRDRYTDEVRSAIERQLETLERVSSLPDIPPEVERLAAQAREHAGRDLGGDPPGTAGSGPVEEAADVSGVDLPPADPVGPSALDAEPDDDVTADARAGE